MENETLDKFFNPKTIAVIGASDRMGAVGGAIFANIKNSDFAGRVFPVNRKSAIVQNEQAFPSISVIGEKIDLAIIAVPAPAVIDVLKDCGNAGARGAVIVSSGFKEAGDDGQKMFSRIQTTAKERGIRVLGPNCLGFANPRVHLNASFAPALPHPGSIALISQSGALCDTFLDWSLRDNIGFSHFVSIGSMADIGFEDLIEYFDNDKNTGSIMLYMESINNAQRFIAAAKKFSQTKPIICLKGGNNESGAKAAASHTGALAGGDKAFDAAFKAAGIIRARTVSDFFNYAKTLNHFAKPGGNRLAIITNAGGPGVLSADFLADNGGQLAPLSSAAIKSLDVNMPAAWSRANPIDVLGDGRSRHYRAALETCLKEPRADGILIIVAPQAVTQADAIAQEIAACPNTEKKPVFASFMGAEQLKAGVEILRAAKVPVYRTPEKAINCFLGLNEWQRNIKNLGAKSKNPLPGFKPKTKTAQRIIYRAIKDQVKLLSPEDAFALLNAYELSPNPVFCAKTADQAAAIAEKIGFPAAMKLHADNLLHKTETGGILLDIGSARAAKAAFAEIIKNGKKYLSSKDIRGVVVEKMVSKKYELFAGAKTDPIFGQVILFGAGGTAVEIINDAAAGLPPLDLAGAKNLMAQTKIFSLLKGYRNLPGADIGALQIFLCRFSHLIQDFPQIAEIDINPLAADQSGITALDPKIILKA